MKTSALFSLLLLVLVAIFDQAKSQVITGLELMNTQTNTVIGPLNDGDLLSVDMLPTSWTIVASATSATQSVFFNMDNGVFTRVENGAPWSMTGDYQGTVYYPWNPVIGGHSLTVTPYPQKRLVGTPGPVYTMSFTVIGTGPPPTKAPVKSPVMAPTKAPVFPPTMSPVSLPTKSPVMAPTKAPVFPPTMSPVSPPTKSPVMAPTKAPVLPPSSLPVCAPTLPCITGLVLIDAENDVIIQNLTNGDTIYITDTVTSIAIVANATKPATKQVKFFLDGVLYQTEKFPPYAMNGNNLTDFWPWPYTLGPHTLSVTALDTNGILISPTYTISFTVVQSALVPSPPTKSPVKAPTLAPVKAPTLAPVKAPTLAPVKAPTLAPVKAPTQAPVTAPMPPFAPVPAPLCKIPKLIGNWESTGTAYPLNIGESQGGMIGTDLFIVSGFVNGYDQCTAHCYARNVNVTGAPWRRMDDIPIPAGITHACTVIVGMKLYMCGGFVGGHPGPDIDACFVYDHTILPGTSGQPQWTSLPSLPSGWAGGSLFYIMTQNALLYTGGARRSIGGTYQDFTDSWLLPLAVNGGINATWMAKPNLPFLANHMSYVSVKDNHGVERYFSLGGQQAWNENNANNDDNYEYVAVNETWVERQKMPLARGHASASTRAVSCGFIIMGGAINSGSNNKRLSTCDVSYYDIPSNTWTHIGNMTLCVNSAVCDIDYVNNYLYCETGPVYSKFSVRIRIEV